MKKFCWTVFLLLAMAAGARCQQHPAQWRAAAPGKAIQPGAKFSVQLSAEITGGWHMYSITQPPGGPAVTVITVPTTQPFKLAGEIAGPAPHTAYDANFEMNTETYEERAEFNVPVALSSNTHPGDQKLNIDVRFQVCNDTMCMPPATEHLTVPVKIEGPKTTVPAAGKSISQTQPLTSSAPQLTIPIASNAIAKNAQVAPVVHVSTARQSFVSFLWLAVLMGGLSL